MPGRELLGYARGRMRAVLEQIDQLHEAEFPYPHSQNVLNIIKERLAEIAARLGTLDAKSNPLVVKKECGIALRALFRYVPLLGFILRSTNVRNAFEVFGPLLRIAQAVLDPKSPADKNATRP